MNRTFIIGHVTKDAETRPVNVKGIPTLVTDFTVAANEGNARAQLEMSNPTVEFIGKKPGDPEDLPFAAEEAVEA